MDNIITVHQLGKWAYPYRDAVDLKGKLSIDFL